MSLRVPIALVALTAFTIGCDLGPLEPDVGLPQQEFCLNEDGDESTNVSFSSDIVPKIFTLEDGFGCDDCHRPDGATPLGVEVGGLDLSSYGSARAGGVVSAGSIIVPGQPCESVLLQKLSPGAPFGARMPLDGPPYLDRVALELLHDWIAEGANDN